MTKEQRGTRERLRGDLDERYDKLLKVIDDAMTATKKVWVDCPSCKKRSQVDVTDTKAALAAAEFAANQSLGRPDVAQSEKDERIVFERVVYMGES